MPPADPKRRNRRCWLAGRDGRSCDGRIDPAHLIPKQTLKRELRTKDRGVIWDRRVIRPICRFHHGQLDNRALRLVRAEIPQETEEFAAEHGIGWWLDRTYGQRPGAAPFVYEHADIPPGVSLEQWRCRNRGKAA